MKIVIIGMGNIGKRWLESILAIRSEKDVFCIEINEIVAKELQERYKERITVYTQISMLPREIDLCAITSTADVRRKIFDDIVDHCLVKYIVFEKVLFQKESDYYHVLNELESRKIKGWVNCTRREMPPCKKLKSRLDSGSYFTLCAGGNHWGLGCNGVHIIDFAAYLGGIDGLEINTSGLIGPVVESKRKGFYEFRGTITGKSGKCRSFQISDTGSDVMTPLVITINSDAGCYVIDETNGIMRYMDNTTNWEWSEEDFSYLYTSQIVGSIV